MKNNIKTREKKMKRSISTDNKVDQMNDCKNKGLGINEELATLNMVTVLTTRTSSKQLQKSRSIWRRSHRRNSNPKNQNFCEQVFEGNQNTIQGKFEKRNSKVTRFQSIKYPTLEKLWNQERKHEEFRECALKSYQRIWQRRGRRFFRGRGDVTRMD
jgi:hypothetical protein